MNEPHSSGPVTLLRTHAGHPGYIELAGFLDAELANRDGADYAFYSQFNKREILQQVVVAIQAGEAIGCGAMKPFDPSTFEIKRMYVSKHLRGRGIASRILAELETWAAELGVNRCVLETGRRQPEAIALYEKRGYSRISNYGQYDGIENSVCFEKKLA